MTADKLRQTYPEFIFHSAHWRFEKRDLKISYRYSAGEHHFEHRLTLPTSTTNELIAPLVFSLGLVEMLSYWKAFASPLITIKAGALTNAQLAWWHHLLIRGMGEYFYLNQIDFRAPDFVTLKSAPSPSTSLSTATSDQAQRGREVSREVSKSKKISLIPLGGGKDSIVTLELARRQLPQADTQLRLLLVNPTEAARAVAKESQLPQLEVRRELDPHLFSLNRRGFLNGHVPFSASLAFLSVLTAFLNQLDEVIISQEASADEPSLTYLGHEINHQYSKSAQFEARFRHYLRELGRQFPTIGQKLADYRSPLRHLTELEIAALFAKLGRPYWHLFLSCNRGSKTNQWCGQCPKCLFTYLILAPWIPEEELVQIFGKNLLTEASLHPIMQALLGETPDKPLECVGMRAESREARRLLLAQAQAQNQTPPLLLRA